MATIDFIDDDDDRPAVRVARSFDAPADRLWNAVSDPAEFVNWFPAEVTFEPVPGALIQFDQDGEKTSGEVLAFEAPRRFAFTWNGDAFDLSVTPEGQTSHLTLLHRFDDRAGAASFATGWEACLEWLDSSLTAGEPPAPGPRKARHEELVAEFGLDRPVIARNDHRWTVLWERQMTAPAETIWNTFFGVDASTGEQRLAPEVGEEFHPGGAPEVTLGTVTEVEAPLRFSFRTAEGEPGDLVRLHLGEGTGHGARLFIEVSGTDPAEIETAIDQWGAGAIAHLAREASR